MQIFVADLAMISFPGNEGIDLQRLRSQSDEFTAANAVKKIGDVVTSEEDYQNTGLEYLSDNHLLQEDSYLQNPDLVEHKHHNIRLHDMDETRYAEELTLVNSDANQTDNLLDMDEKQGAQKLTLGVNMKELVDLPALSNTCTGAFIHFILIYFF